MSEHPTSFAGLFPKTEPPVAKPYVDGGHLVYPPPQRTWVGLTDEEIQTTWDSVMDGSVFTRREVYKAIEAKLRSKNEHRG